MYSILAMNTPRPNLSRAIHENSHLRKRPSPTHPFPLSFPYAAFSAGVNASISSECTFPGLICSRHSLYTNLCLFNIVFPLNASDTIVTEKCDSGLVLLCCAVRSVTSSTVGLISARLHRMAAFIGATSCAPVAFTFCGGGGVRGASAGMAADAYGESARARTGSSRRGRCGCTRRRVGVAKRG